MEHRAAALRDELEDDIRTGIIKPGDRRDETLLADRFGVSRTPIREALFQLAANGLVEHRARRGAYVATVGLQRLTEMCKVMAELEAMCARHAARRTSSDDLRKIASAHQACIAAAEAGGADAYHHANEEFHARVRRVSGNSFLLEEVDRLQKRLKSYRRLQLRARDRIRSSLAEHEVIARAIEAGFVEDAGSAMRRHVGVQGDRFADRLATFGRAKATKTT